MRSFRSRAGRGVALAPAATVFDRLEAADPDRWVTRPSIARLSATPVMAGGRLYLATPIYQAAAVDARTGETAWVHNPRVYEQGSPPLPAPWNHRGVAYWEGGGEAHVIWGTGDGRLTAVDAATGLPAADFGEDGGVSLEAGLPRARENPSRLPPPSRSPPLVVGDTVVVGSLGPRLPQPARKRPGLRARLRRGGPGATAGTSTWCPRAPTPTGPTPG